MKTPALPIFSLLVWSLTASASQQSHNAGVAHATAPQLSFAAQTLLSDATADVRSMVLRHVANVTALFAEEYLKDLVARDAFGINGSARAERIERALDWDRVIAPEKYGPAQPSTDASGLRPQPENKEATRNIGLLPPSWPSLSIKPLVPATCHCDCSTPTTPCCIKICVNHSRLRTDQRPLNSTADAEGSDQAQAIVSDMRTEVGTKQIAEPQMLASCPCNCNNPTTACCIKICVNHLKAKIDQQLPTSAAVNPEPQQTQAEPVNVGEESDIEQVAESQMQASCDCNCNNPKTPCCIKICVNHFKARLDQLLPSSAATAARPDQAQATLPDTEPAASLSVDADDSGRGRANDVDVGMVALKTSLGSHLTLKADSDLDLYASFVSQTLVQDLGLAAQVHVLASSEPSTIVIKDEAYHIVGTVPIAVEAYTRKNFAFEDLFYVVERSQEVVGAPVPGLVFGIDHVRQVEGLALKADLFG